MQIRARALAGVLILFTACGEGVRPSGLSAGTVTTAPTGASTGALDGSGGEDPTDGATTTSGPDATTDAPCAELTLCPGTSTHDPGTSSSGTTSTTTGEPPPPPPPPVDPCAGVDDGAHCGGDLGGLADHNSLYECQGGLTVGAAPCQAGCENAACKQVGQDPCASAMSGDGKYCGGTLMGGDAAQLYDCKAGATIGKTFCEAGCKVNPPGVADACNVVGDPCSGAESGDGKYCGSGLPGGDPNDLYDCAAKMTASKTTCPNGCQVNPPGIADACKPVDGGGECCLAKPPGALTQSYSACGGGGSHYGIDYGTAVGTPIYAGMAGTVVASALGHPNCYDNGCTQQCWNAFNFVKLKADCGDPSDGSRDFFIYYLHIDALAPGVQNGAHLDQGQLLALSGNSGCSSGPHIHIETVSVPKGQSGSLGTCNSQNPASDYCP